MAAEGAALPVDAAHGGEASVRGEAALRALERLFLWLDRALGRALPDALNPFLQTGAVALAALFIATATGILLLFWYRPSLHLAYDSVAAMASARWSAGLLRSLHRYSSDACLFFGLVHALRLFFERRFSGARWVAWVTGIFSLAVLWILGWTGYWLVWDVRAKYVAVETAKVLDALPIFTDPMGRSFLFDEGINSLLFFVVFFFHMLVPLALAFLLWLHLTRTARALPHSRTDDDLGARIALDPLHRLPGCKRRARADDRARRGVRHGLVVPVPARARPATVGWSDLDGLPRWRRARRRGPVVAAQARRSECGRRRRALQWLRAVLPGLPLRGDLDDPA